MKNIRLFALIFLVSLIAMVGCGGSSGGDSVPTFEKDVAGITATLDKFAAALRTGDVASAGLFAQTSADQATRILYVRDFGVDINNPADNQQWEFSVLQANINQTAPNAAIVRASKVMSTGKTLWLVFAMVRDQGVWLIEGISVEETGTAGAFVTQRYFPIAAGSSMKYLESGTSPSFSTEGFSATDKIEKNGMFFYRQTFDSESPLAGSFRAQRAALFAEQTFYLGYSPTGELWAYAAEVNGGQPYRLMKATYAFGEKEIITETYPFGTYVTTMTIGSQKEFKTTPLRTFETIPVLEEVRSSVETAQATETSKMYFADGVGIVLTEYFGTDLTKPESTDQLFERYANGLYDRNLPEISSNNGTSQSVIIGKPMIPVIFNAKDGTRPYTWSLENVPAGISINPQTGEMAGTPPSELTTHYINVVATDVYGRRGFKQFDLAVVKAPPFNIVSDNAMLGAGSTYQLIIGQPLQRTSFSGSSKVGAVNVVEWSITGGLPSGITFNPSTGALSGRDASTAEANYPITIHGVDDQGGIGDFSFTLAVVKAPPITITSDNAMLSAGSNYQLILGQPLQATSFAAFTTVGGGAVTVVEWSITGTLPSGITFNPSTGTLSGTDASTAGANYPVTIHAVDSQGGTGNFTFTLAVVKAPPITITSDNAMLSAGSNYQLILGQPLQATSFAAFTTVGGGAVTVVEWSITGTLPSGITFNPSTGTLSGTDASTAGANYPVTIHAVDSQGGTGNFTFTLAVEKASPLTLSTSDALTSQTVVAGDSITPVAFSAAGSLGGTITWSVAGNPSGINIDSNGYLSGAIDVMATAQVISLTVTAVDNYGATGSINYAITVQAKGTYYIPDYYPTVPGDQYEYAQLPDLRPTADRTMVEILPDKVALPIAGGEVVDFYKDVTTDIPAPVTPTVSVRAAVRPSLRGSLRGTLRAQTTPQDIYYRGQDSQGNIWQYNEIINNAVPYKIFPAWMNPGDEFEFTQNINDEVHPAQTAVTRVVIGSSLVNGVKTPLGVYDNVMKIVFYTTLTLSDLTTQKFASELYCSKNLGIVAYSSYTDQTLAVCDYQELLLSTLLAGARTDNPLLITTPAALTYSTGVTLNATGGESSKGYAWSLVSGTLPAGLSLAPSGAFTGSASPGTYVLEIKATDYYFRTATKTFTMTVP
ncbi:MAG TPA: Ig domain-containing protein [Candidatus Rifleibacterium sp.]|nr:Ig domain-containing protein [Candidatus Rifleibacterium sp.]